MSPAASRHTAWMLRGLLLSLVAGLAALGGGWLAFGSSGGGATRASASVSQPAAHDAAPAAQRPAAPAQQDSKLPPLPTMRPRVVEPQAGGSGDAAAAPATAPAADPGLSDAGPAPTVPATSGAGHGTAAPGGTGSVHEATALPNGIAVPPLEAPAAIKRMIDAGNAIARTPYIWGGGHGRWIDKGYDCSGSVSFVLAAAGYLQGPLDSGHLAQWGDPGPGRWVTIYANSCHVFMEVAGIRFDTSGQRVTGSRWQNDGRSTAGFAVRHPPGL
jgi:cell wall-associated NlpC family hydrolase